MKIQEQYPRNFSMEEFNSIRSYAGKIRYATERLKRLGSGSSRIVFQVDDSKVLKLAKNGKGLAQNSVENDGYMNMVDITADVLACDEMHDDPYWIEMELAIPLNRKKKLFEKMIGMDSFEFHKALTRLGEDNSFPDGVDDEDHPLWDLFADIHALAGNMGMPLPGDFARSSSWGIVKRDNKPKLVLIDFGFTNDVRAHYYSR